MSPSGDPSIPPEVKRAKYLWRSIEAACSVSNLDDDEEGEDNLDGSDDQNDDDEDDDDDDCNDDDDDCNNDDDRGHGDDDQDEGGPGTHRNVNSISDSSIRDDSIIPKEK